MTPDAQTAPSLPASSPLASPPAADPATLPATIPASGAPRSSFRTPERPRWEDYSRCIHCGLCLNACPTFRLLGEEMDSPRGRLYQIAQADAGRLGLDDDLFRHLDLCLNCRACESACPSGVEYAKVLERARAEVEAAKPPRSRATTWARNWFFQAVLAEPDKLARLARWLRWYQRGGPRALARGSGLLRLLRLEGLERLAPEMETRFFAAEMGGVFPARGARRARVGLLAGCIQRVAFAEIHRATLRALQAAGCEVVVPGGQTCCGALHVHAGRREEARALARRNFAAFAGGLDAIIVNSAGCGAAMKEYGDLFTAAPDQPAAAEFGAKVRDVSEWLVEMDWAKLPLRPVARRVTYQDPCHLAHAQKIRAAPRQLLRAIPGLELVEMERSDACCGAAGVYNLVHPEIAAPLLAEKMAAIRATQAPWVVTANPGCLLQLRAGAAGGGQRVLHLLEVLDLALPPAEA